MNKLIIAGTLALVIAITGCTGDDPIQFMKWAETFFPMEVGDTWYYTFYGPDDTIQIKREVKDEFDLDGVMCMPVLEDGVLEECWRIDSSGFWVHLLSFQYYPDPPLLIPFNMRSDEPYRFDSHAGLRGNPSAGFDIKGYLTFEGYVTKSVPAGTFKNCLKLRYDVEGDEYNPGYTYFEYYAPGVGLLDNGDVVLDSAEVGGVFYR